MATEPKQAHDEDGFEYFRCNGTEYVQSDEYYAPYRSIANIPKSERKRFLLDYGMNIQTGKFSFSKKYLFNDWHEEKEWVLNKIESKLHDSTYGRGVNYDEHVLLEKYLEDAAFLRKANKTEYDKFRNKEIQLSKNRTQEKPYEITSISDYMHFCYELCDGNIKKEIKERYKNDMKPEEKIELFPEPYRHLLLFYNDIENRRYITNFAYDNFSKNITKNVLDKNEKSINI